MPLLQEKERGEGDSVRTWAYVPDEGKEIWGDELMTRTNHLKVLLTASVAALTALLLTVLSTGKSSQAAADTSVFSVQCLSTHQLPDDPIVYPGVPGEAHMHEFIGNPSTNADSAFDSMRAAQGSVKCDTQSDTSGYWVPALYTQDGTRIPITSWVLLLSRTARGSTDSPWPEDGRWWRHVESAEAGRVAEVAVVELCRYRAVLHTTTGFAHR